MKISFRGEIDEVKKKKLNKNESKNVEQTRLFSVVLINLFIFIYFIFVAIVKNAICIFLRILGKNKLNKFTDTTCLLFKMSDWIFFFKEIRNAFCRQAFFFSTLSRFEKKCFVLFIFRSLVSCCVTNMSLNVSTLFHFFFYLSFIQSFAFVFLLSLSRFSFNSLLSFLPSFYYSVFLS